MYRGWKHSKQIAHRGAGLPDDCDRCTRPHPNPAERHLITDDNGRITILSSICFYHNKIRRVVGDDAFDNVYPVRTKKGEISDRDQPTPALQH